ncbi:MAG: ABC transporter substrate-binding protein [Alphaproteobacteria bacterium]|nr:ABC transporter substrate-binding protein [Alphaproteobacteria bacterium]
MIQKYKKILLTAALGLSLTVATAQAEAKETSAQVAVESAAMEMMDFINTQKLSPTKVDIRKIENLLNPIIDFNGIARAVMGKHRKTMNDDQKTAFNRVFKETMVNLYSKSFTEFDITNINVKPIENQTDKKAAASMVVTEASGKKYNVNYSLRLVDGNWKVRNVILDGVNMGLTYRNQFNSAMTQYDGDIEKVISSWNATVNGNEHIATK